MKTSRTVQRGALVLGLVATLAACGGKESVTAPTAMTAPLTVFVTDAVGNLASVRVTVARLSVFDTSGREAALSPPASEIDLVAAHDNPARLGVFGIPVGSYNRVRGAINVLGFTTTDHPDRTCSFEPNPFAFDFATDKAALIVTEQGLKITVDVPLDPHAECPADGSVGTLSLRDVTVTLGWPEPRLRPGARGRATVRSGCGGRGPRPCRGGAGSGVAT